MLLASCGRKTMNAAELVAYLNRANNGLVKEKTIDHIRYKAQLKPADYIIASEFRSREVSPDAYAKRAGQLKETLWFNLAFSAEQPEQSVLRYNVSGLDEYNQRLSYFLSRAMANIRCEAGGQELKLISYHFEPNYNLTPYDCMVVGFEWPGEPGGKDQPILLSYTDELFGNGIVRFSFLSKDLLDAPALAVKK